MQAIGVGVGQDADLAVTQSGDVVLARITTDGHGEVMHFLRSQYAAGFHFPGVEDLAAQGQDGLEILVAGLARRAACRITFDQKQFGARKIAGCAIGELAGQGRALGDLLADNLFLGLEPQRRAFDGELGNLLADIDVLVQIKREAIVGCRLHQGRGIPRRQALLGLPRELRFLHAQ